MVSTQDRFLVAIDKLVAAARRVEQLAAEVGSDVRQDAELRHGVDAGDMAVLDDPVYGAALDQCTRAATVLRDAEALRDGARRSPREVKQ